MQPSLQESPNLLVLTISVLVSLVLDFGVCNVFSLNKVTLPLNTCALIKSSVSGVEGEVFHVKNRDCVSDS